MKTIVYKDKDGKDMLIEYDEKLICFSCGLTIIEASQDGTNFCKWCANRVFRNGKLWSPAEQTMFNMRTILAMYAHKDEINWKGAHSHVWANDMVKNVGAALFDSLSREELKTLLELTLTTASKEMF